MPPRIVAAAFCKSYLAPESCLPALRLTPDPKTGNCRFFEGSACTIHAARPLACALYPLGQSIDTVTAQMEYYVQTPLCGARAGEARTLQDYLQDSAVLDRAGVDARWAIVCTQLSHQLQAAGGADNPRFSAAVRRMERALYYDYELNDDFYPQFCQNIEISAAFGQDAVKNSFVGSGLDRSVQLCGRNQRPGGVKTPPYKISRKLSDAGK